MPADFCSSLERPCHVPQTTAERFKFELRFDIQDDQPFEPLLPYAWARRAVRSKTYKWIFIVYFAFVVVLSPLRCPVGSFRPESVTRVVGLPLLFIAFAAIDRNLLKVLASTFEFAYVPTELLIRLNSYHFHLLLNSYLISLQKGFPSTHLSAPAFTPAAWNILDAFRGFSESSRSFKVPEKLLGNSGKHPESS